MNVFLETEVPKKRRQKMEIKLILVALLCGAAIIGLYVMGRVADKSGKTGDEKSPE